MPGPNYRQAKKQKELSRKARQLEKQRRRTARPDGSVDDAAPLQDQPLEPIRPNGGT